MSALGFSINGFLMFNNDAFSEGGKMKYWLNANTSD